MDTILGSTPEEVSNAIIAGSSRVNIDHVNRYDKSRVTANIARRLGFAAAGYGALEIAARMIEKDMVPKKYLAMALIGAPVAAAGQIAYSHYAPLAAKLREEQFPDHYGMKKEALFVPSRYAKPAFGEKLVRSMMAKTPTRATVNQAVENGAGGARGVASYENAANVQRRKMFTWPSKSQEYFAQAQQNTRVAISRENRLKFVANHERSNVPRTGPISNVARSIKSAFVPETIRAKPITQMAPRPQAASAPQQTFRPQAAFA